MRISSATKNLVAELMPLATLKSKGLSYNCITPDTNIEPTFDCDTIYNFRDGTCFFVVNSSGNTTTPEQNGILLNITRKGGANCLVLQYFISESKNIFRRIGKWRIGDVPQYDDWIKI